MTDEEIQNNITAFTQIAYKLDQAYEQATSGKQKPNWNTLSEEDRGHIIDRAVYYLTDKSAVVSSLHERWIHAKYNEGWTYAPTFDEAKKHHPLLISYADLPLTRRVGDLLFMQTIQTLSRLL
jgi:hypothetical protein